jgi:phage terminase large subunit GpA-like protein
MPSALEILNAAAREAFAPREVLYVDEWADRYRFIPKKGSVLHGKWSTDLTPYLRRPMRVYNHRAVRHISFMKASQVGGTEMIENCKLFTIDCDPANSLVMFPIIDDARNFNQDRFLPSLRACPQAARHLLPSPQETKDLKINFDHMLMHFVGSNSKSGRRSRPAGRIFLDEVSAYVDPRYREVYDRKKGSDGDYKIIDTGTPDDEHTGIHEVFEQGSREYYYIPCPHCGTFQRLVFKGLVWEGGVHARADVARATARYICQEEAGGCGKPIYDYHKPEMLRRGVWVPHGDDEGHGRRELQDVLENGEGSSAGAGTAPGAEGYTHLGAEVAHVSFQVNSLYSPFRGANLGEMAAAFIEESTPEFVRGWIGEPFVPPGERLELKELARMCVPFGDGGYRLSEVADGVLAIVRAVDVQKDCVYIADLGVGLRGRDWWLVNFQRVPRKEGNRLADVWPLVLNRYKRSRKTETLPVAAEFIDTGFFTEEMYWAVLERRAMGVQAFAVKGKKRAGAMAAPWRLSTIDKMPGTGEEIKGGLRLLEVNSDFWKTAVTGRVRGIETPDLVEQPEDEHDAEAVGRVAARAGGRAGERADDREGESGRRTPEVAPGFYLPEKDAGGRVAMYIRHLISEHRKLDRGPKENKYPQWVWELRAGHAQNHGFDATCYAMCGADFRGSRLLGVRKKAPPRKEPETSRGGMKDFVGSVRR